MPVDNPSGSHLCELRDGDHVVGVCSQRVRAVHSMITELREKFDDYRTCLEGDGLNDKSERIVKWRGDAYILNRKIKVLESLLIVFIHEDVPELMTKRCVAIRRGWQLCYVDESKIEEALKQAGDILCAVLMTKASGAGEEFGNN